MQEVLWGYCHVSEILPILHRFVLRQGRATLPNERAVLGHSSSNMACQDLCPTCHAPPLRHTTRSRASARLAKGTHPDAEARHLPRHEKKKKHAQPAQALAGSFDAINASATGTPAVQSVLPSESSRKRVRSSPCSNRTRRWGPHQRVTQDGDSRMTHAIVSLPRSSSASRTPRASSARSAQRAWAQLQHARPRYPCRNHEA